MSAPARLLKLPDGGERPENWPPFNVYGTLNPKNPIFGVPTCEYQLWNPNVYFTDSTFSTIQKTGSGAVGGVLDTFGNYHATQNTGGNRPTMELAQGEGADQNGFVTPALKCLRASGQFLNLPSIPQSNCGAIILAYKNLGYSGNQTFISGPNGTSYNIRINGDGRFVIDQTATTNMITATHDEASGVWTTIVISGDPLGNYYRMWIDGIDMGHGFDGIGPWAGGTQTLLGCEAGATNCANTLIGGVRFYSGVHWNTRLAIAQTRDFQSRIRMEGI